MCSLRGLSSNVQFKRAEYRLWLQSCLEAWHHTWCLLDSGSNKKIMLRTQSIHRHPFDLKLSESSSSLNDLQKPFEKHIKPWQILNSLQNIVRWGPSFQRRACHFRAELLPLCIVRCWAFNLLYIELSFLQKNFGANAPGSIKSLNPPRPIFGPHVLPWRPYIKKYLLKWYQNVWSKYFLTIYRNIRRVKSKCNPVWLRGGWSPGLHPGSANCAVSSRLQGCRPAGRLTLELVHK